MSKIGKIFGIKPPKAQGPDPELLAAQRKQQERLDKQEADQKKTDKANKAVIAARSGRGQGVTLQASTGERGVSGKLGGENA